MADMDVDVAPTTTVAAPSAPKGKTRDDGKEAKKRFEVKKVRHCDYASVDAVY